MLTEFTLTPLKVIQHPQGDVYRALRADEASYKQFGEAYFSTIKQNEIKGWKKHREVTLNIVVPVGKIIFVLYSKERNKF